MQLFAFCFRADYSRDIQNRSGTKCVAVLWHGCITPNNVYINRHPTLRRFLRVFKFLTQLQINKIADQDRKEIHTQHHLHLPQELVDAAAAANSLSDCWDMRHDSSFQNILHLQKWQTSLPVYGLLSRTGSPIYLQCSSPLLQWETVLTPFCFTTHRLMG